MARVNTAHTLKHLLLLSVTIMFSGQPVFSQVDNEDFTPPTLPVCELGIGLTIQNNNDCLLFSGEVEHAFVNSASDGNFGLFSTKITVASITKLDGIRAVGSITFGGTQSYLGWSSPTLYSAGTPTVSQAYIAIGDKTFVRAGLNLESIANTSDDQPFDWLNENGGVSFRSYFPQGGAGFQLIGEEVSGFSVLASLENITPNTTDIFQNHTADNAGTLTGVINYNSSATTAHATFLAGGILDGNVENFGIHLGVTHSFGNSKLRAAIAAQSNGIWEALTTAQTTFDMFTLSVTARKTSNNITDISASIEAKASDDFTLKLGARAYDNKSGYYENGKIYSVGAEYNITEHLTLSGSVGIHFYHYEHPSYTSDFNTNYVSGELEWMPGGGFTMEAKGTRYSTGAWWYSVTSTKEF